MNKANAIEVEVYDPILKTWSEAATMNVERAGFQTAVINKRFIQLVDIQHLVT
ncbi:kelch repeat-containing protein [Chengkuizengella axinellae]|uniref:Kelch repeat-containing protein n=1 Tax=Chengkuizengella axinellae TaxID=3064388 RepID=A0ABT9IXV8_9BACL|nr:kelch repeat-containing protein [Chengkuizengella sp. 2205SS18-9]MDP5273630.1 kelch repeat-containing protein [Chengkuizengella sp. 2205SS18-9]